MSFRTRLATVVAVACIAVGAFAAAGAVKGGTRAAGAATAPCAGYTYQSKSAIRVPYGAGVHKTVGYAYWYQKFYPHSATRVCAVTRPTSTYLGKTNFLYIFLQSDGASVHDGGNYHYYAGPVVVARTGRTTVYAEVRLKPAYGGLTYSTMYGGI